MCANSRETIITCLGQFSHLHICKRGRTNLASLESQLTYNSKNFLSILEEK